jgi:antibiotic biosynthesis monooxygenase (ABM) superfamily enzyme
MLILSLLIRIYALLYSKYSVYAILDKIYTPYVEAIKLIILYLILTKVAVPNLLNYSYMLIITSLGCFLSKNKCFKNWFN